MIRSCYILFVITQVTLHLNAQVITFEKNYGYMANERGLQIEQTVSGAYLILASGPYLMKIDSAGKFIWQKEYEGLLNVLQKTADDKFLILTSNGGSLSIIKINEYGDSLTTIPVNVNSFNDPTAVYELYDGSYILMDTRYTTFPNQDIYLLKITSQGDSIWLRSYGGTGVNTGNKLLESNDSTMVVVGFSNIAPSGIWMFNIDGNGNTNWSKIYKTTYGASDARLDLNNGLIALYDNYFSPYWAASFNLLKTNVMGDSIWSKTYGGTNDLYIAPYSIDQSASDGGFIIGGVRYVYEDSIWSNHIFIMKTDSNGDSLWTRTFKGMKNKADDFAWSVKATNDSGFILTGQRFISDFTGTDVYVIKTDSLGKVYPPDTTTGVVRAKNENYKYEIYPNPNQGNFMLVMASVNQNLKTSVYLYNILGELVYENDNIKNDYLNIDISAQPKGIYLIKVKRGDEIFTDKIIHQ